MAPRWKARAMYKQRASFQPSLNREAHRSILDDLANPLDELQDNSSGEIDSGPSSPYHVVSPIRIGLNDPIGGATGWLNHEGRIYNTLDLEGELDLIANSDEKAMGVKIGTLGYTPSGSAHTPFELLSETEAGAMVFLAPSESASDQALQNLDPDADFSNHSTAALIARSTPLGTGLLPNLNLTSVGSANASGATASPSVMHVLIKAGSPSGGSSPESLCATFYGYSARNYTNSDSPLFLERCDNSFLPGGPSNSVSSDATQLWQYDPKTHELKPLIRSDPTTSDVLSTESNSSPPAASSVVGASGGTITSRSFDSSVEMTRTTASQSSEATQQAQSYTSDNTTSPSSSEVAEPSQVIVRRRGNGHTEADGSVAPRYTVVTVVEPYTLVFVPRAAPGSRTTLPDSPV